MNQEECEWIVAGDEKYKAEDNAQKQKVEARNQPENSRSKAKKWLVIILGTQRVLRTRL